MVAADIRMGPLFRTTLPFLVAAVICLVLGAVFPAMSTWLPNLTLG